MRTSDRLGESFLRNYSRPRLTHRCFDTSPVKADGGAEPSQVWADRSPGSCRVNDYPSGEQRTDQRPAAFGVFDLYSLVKECRELRRTEFAHRLVQLMCSQQGFLLRDRTHDS